MSRALTRLHCELATDVTRGTAVLIQSNTNKVFFSFRHREQREATCSSGGECGCLALRVHRLSNTQNCNL